MSDSLPWYMLLQSVEEALAYIDEDLLRPFVFAAAPEEGLEDKTDVLRRLPFSKAFA